MSPTATATGPGRQRVAASNGDSAPAAVEPSTAWAEYLAAARQLDGVRRSAAAAAGEQARSAETAREELTVVRTGLASQQERLRELGVPAISLVPSPPEVTEASRSMAGGPAAVLAALRAARGWAEAADVVLAARPRFRPGSWPARVRNLLVYGPLALVVPLIQVAVYAATGVGPASVAALISGLPMPAVAFVAGWVGIGRLFRVSPAERLDRTVRLGALVCLVPAVLVTAGLLLVLLAG
ncbi:hypothetical protein [Micromonospora sp. NPDC005203]|uniref:hypothetical protein n=1 Tax=Micromonospora sp. NPDC005203 TaxID=3364226 RepID=UPI0036D0E985